MMKKLTSSLIAAMLLFGAAAAHAQVKVGYVDLQKALMSVNEGRKAKSRLEKKVKDKQKAFDRMQNDVKRLKDELEQQAAIMKDDLKRKKVQEYQRKLMELQDFYMGNQRELADAESKLTKPIFERFERILQEIGAKENFTLIFEKNATVYHAPEVDLTGRLIRDFNAGKGK